MKIKERTSYMNDIETLKIVFSVPQGIRLTPSIGSIMQGILMEHIDTHYAATLHTHALHPYSQYTRYYAKSRTLHWYISALTNQACQEIIQPLSTLPDEVYLKKKKLSLPIIRRSISYMSTYERLAKKYISPAQQLPHSPSIISYQFISPTILKKQGLYLYYPEYSYLISSLLRKWNTFSHLDFLNTPEISTLLINHPFRIEHYNLKMNFFSVERIKIPAFQGYLDVKLPQNTMAQHILLLLSDYANCSGVGIKTAIGMGAMHKKKK